ncbi:Hsp20/alpha crystallin family protein [Euzebya rosea]|uniref:Hsp20/alpha crystallin family protein n=1 Tax=Euzebya rosea TaxID=2052804 RepID=UPI000D3E5990|nr:Hsp20/alpha crystallin family protein [Euzebya rosea]
MSIVRWDPWGELAAMQRDVSRTLAGTAGSSSWLPPADIFRTDDAFVIRMDVPGMREPDLQIAVEDGQLTVSLERHADEKVQDDQWIRRERSVGRFERSFSLPEGVEHEQITANLDAGVLELRVPKPREKQPHRIPITATA